jgi:pimeloyl-ACP methyl ester carboxylesterase
MKILSKLIKILFLAILAISLLVCLFFGHKDKSVADLKAKYAQESSAFVPIDSMDVHYRDEGNPNDSVPIVLIHGTGSSLHTFDNWASVLRGQNRVVRMDIPAFGLTGPFPSHNYAIANYVDFINKFLKNRGIKHCILGGNSLGGQIAWQFTLAYPDMVKKLILIDAAGYPLKSKSIPIGFRIARIPVLNKIMTFVTPRFMVKKSLENVYVDKTQISEALVDRYFDLTLREGNRQALVDRMTGILDNNNIPRIKTIQKPTLVLWGENDGLIPIENAQHFHDDLPNDTLVILKKMGHVPMEENPTESLKPVVEFLKKNKA